MCFLAGNAGFETADNIVGSAAYIHMASRYEKIDDCRFCGVTICFSSCPYVSRSRIRMAFQTHYVGDLRSEE